MYIHIFVGVYILNHINMYNIFIYIYIIYIYTYHIAHRVFQKLLQMFWSVLICITPYCTRVRNPTGNSRPSSQKEFLLTILRNQKRKRLNWVEGPNMDRRWSSCHFGKLTQMPLPYQVICRLTAKIMWPEILSLSVITDSTKTSTCQNGGQKMLRQGFWEYRSVVMMVDVFLWGDSTSVPCCWCSFWRVSSFCWCYSDVLIFHSDKGVTVIVTLVVYVEFEMRLVFIQFGNFSKILWKIILMLSSVWFNCIHGICCGKVSLYRSAHPLLFLRISGFDHSVESSISI